MIEGARLKIEDWYSSQIRKLFCLLEIDRLIFRLEQKRGQSIAGRLELVSRLCSDFDFRYSEIRERHRRAVADNSFSIREIG